MTDARKPGRVPRIVLVSDSLDAGGAERVMSDMASYWVRRAWDITLFTWSGSAADDFYCVPAGVDRVSLGMSSTKGANVLGKLRTHALGISQLRKLLNEKRPDVVLSFLDVPNIQTLIAAAGLDARVVVSERGNPEQTESRSDFRGMYHLGKPWQLLRKYLYRRANVVTALNKDTAAWLNKECGVAVEVIPNPLRALPTAGGEREELVVGIGRLVDEKGFDLLLRAFATIAAEFPSWRLVILGKGPNRAQLIHLRDELGLADRLEIMPPEKNVEHWMARAGLVVLPSRLEAYGNAALESLGMGAPLITTRCSGPSSFVKDGINGRLVPIEDPIALSAAMAELMSDASLRAKFGKEALKIRVTHSQDAIMQHWERCLLPTWPACRNVTSHL